MRILRSPIVILLSLLLFGCLGLSWLIAGDPVRQSRWDSVQLGMTRSSVQQLMGPPNSFDGLRQIEYGHPLNMGWVEFHFNDADTLIEKNDESVFGSLGSSGLPQ